MDICKYWNDISVEKQKVFWIEDEKDPKLQQFLREETNLERCFLDSLSFAGKLREVRGRVLDVGAGVAWTSAIVSRMSHISKVVALDFSQHRLTRIAPIVFKQYAGEIGKFEPIVGDFNTHEWGTRTFEVIIFCQSLYHFSDLKTTLERVKNMLVPGGMVIVSCERIVAGDRRPWLSFDFYKKRLKWFLKGRADRSGNYLWTDGEYERAIRLAGLEYFFQFLDYSVYHSKCSTLAGNYFGIKR